MNGNYQVIIIGAGPSGSHTAYKLAEHGIRVLVLEKFKLPRSKCCAGGLTVRTTELLGIDTTGMAEDVISGAIVSFREDKDFCGFSDRPFMYTVMRKTFDNMLVKRAREAGAEILQDVEVDDIYIDETGIRVKTSHGEYSGEFLVGADGSKSRVRKTAGIRQHEKRIIGLQAEVRVPDEVMSVWKSKIGIDIGLIRGGYGWVFPKSRHLTIGIIGPERQAKKLKKLLDRYIDSLGLGKYSIIERGAGLLPVYTGKQVFSRGRAILVGDAAGLADPLTGEGLYNAVLSAELGAAAIETALKNGENTISSYDNAVEKIIVPQMKIAGIFSKALALIPGQLVKALHKDKNMWQSCCDVLYGSLDYVTIKDRVSSLSRLYKIVSRLL